MFVEVCNMYDNLNFKPNNLVPPHYNFIKNMISVNFFLQVSNGLPPTSYIKMIEYYLIFCLLVPCAEVLLHTVMDSLRL